MTDKTFINKEEAAYDFSSLNFGEAKRRMCVLKTREAINKFYEIFSELVKNGSWVSAPVNGNQLVISPFRGGHYIAIYSDMYGRIPGDSKDVITLDINKFIDILYDNPHLLGIVVDPNKDPFLINRKAINDLTVRKDPLLQVKDWGNGIPSYTEKDEINPYYEWDICFLGFSQYLINRLNLQRCNTVGDLAKMTVQDLRKIDGIGKKSCAEIIEKMEAIGIPIVDLDAERKISYPRNLIAAVIGEDPNGLPKEYNQDHLSGISYALDTLSDREREIIILQYVYSVSDQKIGKYYELSRQRVHQIHCKALRKLRHPSRYSLLKNGLRGHCIEKVPRRDREKVEILYDFYMRGYNDGVADAVAKKEQYLSTSFQQAMEELNLPASALDCLQQRDTDRVLHLFDIVRNEPLLRFLQNNDNVKTNTVNTEAQILQKPIEDLELSIRAFNCLKRAGVNTIEDLLELDLETIRNIRNLNLKSQVEIAEKLKQCNICNNVWESVLMIPQPIEKLELPIRCFNCLKRSGVETVEDILKFDSVESIHKIRNLGRHGAQAIAFILHEHGLCIGPWASLL